MYISFSIDGIFLFVQAVYFTGTDVPQYNLDADF